MPARFRSLAAALALVTGAVIGLGAAGAPSLLAQTTGTGAVTIDGLGTIDFPATGSAEARASFLRGVLLMHSFEYGAAAEAFRRAREADPGSRWRTGARP